MESGLLRESFADQCCEAGAWTAAGLSGLAFRKVMLRSRLSPAREGGVGWVDCLGGELQRKRLLGKTGTE